MRKLVIKYLPSLLLKGSEAYHVIDYKSGKVLALFDSPLAANLFISKVKEMFEEEHDFLRADHALDAWIMLKGISLWFLDRCPKMYKFYQYIEKGE